jgi:hypothetical protein
MESFGGVFRLVSETNEIGLCCNHAGLSLAGVPRLPPLDEKAAVRIQNAANAFHKYDENDPEIGMVGGRIR